MKAAGKKRTDPYGVGCEAGRARAATWLADPNRGNPLAGGTLTAHVHALADQVSKAKSGPSYARARGAVAGFCCAIEGCATGGAPAGGASASAVAAPQRKAARERLDEMQLNIEFELVPLLQGLATLTNALRVLEQFDVRASVDPAFDQSLRQVCPYWRDPLAEPTAGMLADFAQVVHDRARALAELATVRGEA